MSLLERIELALIPVAAVVVALASVLLPASLSTGHLLLVASAALLAQSLVRDLSLLRASRRKANAAPKRAARCMCIESALGATGIVAGALLLAAGVPGTLQLDATRWGLGALLVFGAGFAIKDLVFEWRPWRIRRDKDHMNLIVRW